MKRYMVFSYTTYDNPSPFDCLEGSFDNVGDAVICAAENEEYCKEDPDCSQFSVIFDRVSGGFVNHKSNKL